MAEKKRPLNPDTQNALMGDLESIKTLLESDEDEIPSLDDSDDDALDIPVLDDVVAKSTQSRPGPELTQDTWKMASDAFIAHARALLMTKGLGAHLTEVQSALIDALVDTLKTAVDQEVEHIRTELHTRLQAELDHIKSELSKDED